jgi:hypothetical protein
VLRVFIAHYNGHRPHRALNLTPPDRAAGTLRARNASPLQKLRGQIDWVGSSTNTASRPEDRDLRTPTGRAQALTVANIEYAGQSLAGIDEDGALEIGNSNAEAWLA